MGKYADRSSLREKKVTLTHSLRCKKHIMVGKAAAVQLAFYSQEAEQWMRAWMDAWTHAWMHACQSIPFCTVQDPLPGNDPLTVNVPSHINEHSQDNPPQTCPEPRLSSDFPCQADNELQPSEPPFWHSILGVFISAGFFLHFLFFWLHFARCSLVFDSVYYS